MVSFVFVFIPQPFTNDSRIEGSGKARRDEHEGEGRVGMGVKRKGEGRRGIGKGKGRQTGKASHSFPAGEQLVPAGRGSRRNGR